MADLKLEGIEDLIAEVEKLGAKGSRIENQALREAGEIVKEAIKQEAPHKTGTLKKSIEASGVKTKDGMKHVEVGPGKEGWYGRFVEFGTVKMRANPLIHDEEGRPYNMARMAGEVTGNGEAKVMAVGVLPVDNDKIGLIDKGNGFLALVKVKIANTTGEVMTVDKILSDGAGENVTFKPEDLAVLGEKALPSTIKPNTIVEGWITFRVGDGREGYGIVIYTSHGRFVLNSINTYRML